MQNGRSRLVINRVTNDDTGEYICEVRDHSSNFNENKRIINVLGKSINFKPKKYLIKFFSFCYLEEGKGYVNIAEEGGKYEIIVKSKVPAVQWLFKCNSFPPAAYEVFDNHGNLIHSRDYSDKYLVQIEANGNVRFKIRHIELQDYGKYKIKAFNEYETKEIFVSLVVREKPITIVNEVSVFEGDEASIVCQIAGFPASTIKWTFIPCSLQPDWPSCDQTQAQDLSERAITTPNTTLAQTSKLYLTPEEPGLIRCTATNTEGTDQSETYIIVSDLKEALEISGIDNDKNHASVGDPAKINCAALAYNFTGDLAWFHNNMPVKSTDNIIVTDTKTKYSYHKTVEWKSMSKEDSGNYECRVAKISKDETDSISWNITVIGNKKNAFQF